MKRLAAIVAVAVAGLATSQAAIIYQNDFEAGLPNGFTPGPIMTAPNSSTKFLGRFSADTTTLNLTGIAAHSMVTIELDLYIIHSWDGNGELGSGPDHFRISADGTDLLNASFSNWSPRQTYSDATPLGGGPFAAKTDADAIGSLGFNDFFGTDTTYHLSFTIAHSVGTLDLAFQGVALQGVGDESWGIDNVVIGADAVPEPATMAVLGLGAASLLRRRRRAA
jgi:hypothetical protein